MERIKKLGSGEYVLVREISDIGETRENISREVALQVVARRLYDIRTELKWIVEILNEYMDTPPCDVGMLGKRECRSIKADQCNCKFAPKL